MDEIYRKEGRRYVKVGHEFTGFPADGYWYVANGRQSLLVPAEHPRPVQQLRYTQYQNTLVNLLIEQWEGKQLSTHDVVQFILEKLEELNYHQLQKEKELLDLLTKDYNETKKPI